MIGSVAGMCQLPWRGFGNKAARFRRGRRFQLCSRFRLCLQFRRGRRFRRCRSRIADTFDGFEKGRGAAREALVIRCGFKQV